MPAPLANLSFFKPIYQSDSKLEQDYERLSWLGRIVEPYFDLDQQSFQRLPGVAEENVVPICSRPWQGSVARVVGIVLKVISYLTIVIPLIMLAGKLIYRVSNQFSVQEPLKEGDRRDHLLLAETILKNSLNMREDISLKKLDKWQDFNKCALVLKKSSKYLADILSNSPASFTKSEHDTLTRGLNELEQQSLALKTKMSGAAPKLFQSWLNAAAIDAKTTERMELFEETQVIVNLLKFLPESEIGELYKDLLNAFQGLKADDLNDLTEWIAKNSSYQGKGTYESIHQLLDVLAKFADVDTRKTLTAIDSHFLQAIENLREKQDVRLVPDIKRIIFSHQLDMEGLFALRGLSGQDREIADNVLNDISMDNLIVLRAEDRQLADALIAIKFPEA